MPDTPACVPPYSKITVNEKFMRRVAALEALWAAFNDPEFARVGYTPKITAAVQRLRELERA